MPTGEEGERRAAAGEAGAADFPERDRVHRKRRVCRRRSRMVWALPDRSSLPRRLRRPRHSVRRIHWTPHARFRFDPRHDLGSLS